MVAEWFIPQYAHRGLFSIIILLELSWMGMDYVSLWQPERQQAQSASNTRDKYNGLRRHFNMGEDMGDNKMCIDN